jgi:hypothetical protein
MIKNELDMLSVEAARLQDHLKEEFAENFSEAKNAVQGGIAHINESARQAVSDAESFRARINEEIRLALANGEVRQMLASEEARRVKKYVDERFGGSSLAEPKAAKKG